MCLPKFFEVRELGSFFTAAEMGSLHQRVRAGHGIYAEPGEACRFTDCSDGGFDFIRFAIPPDPDQDV